jgi:predicted alpha/beta-fold hydrolase
MTKRSQQVQKNPNLTFRPHLLVRNRHLQTILTSIPETRGKVLHQTAREIMLPAGEDIRLQGYYSPQAKNRAKGLVLLLHGWLGSANSNYVLTIGEYLYRQGYAIFRLNLRDHGDTHHLNVGPFRGDLLEETFAAAQEIAKMEASRPLHLVGASLGGNFALRLAWWHGQTPLPNLAHTVAICPVLDPYHATLTIDSGWWLYLSYFRSKWRQAMEKKQAAFPHRYDFSGEIAASSCLEMTEVFVRHHSPYPDARTYFKSYGVTSEMLASLQTPTTIIAAVDDPIIPISDFYALTDLSSYVQLHLQPYGGHVGFVDILPFRRWLGEAVLTVLEG